MNSFRRMRIACRWRGLFNINGICDCSENDGLRIRSGVTRERGRQIELKALHKMSDPSIGTPDAKAQNHKSAIREAGNE